MTVSALRDAILSGLDTLPGERIFHVHILISSPRKHADLYPFAHPRPKTYIQDLLLLISEQPTSNVPRIFVSAVELAIYTIPATSSGILYVTKVDSTGQGAYPSPTANGVKTLLHYYAQPSTRPIAADNLWIQLFARAQSQYLFPNSADFTGKKPLSDIKLCAWWKRVYTELATLLEASGRPEQSIQKLSYLLPGMNELEALQSLKAPPDTQGWVYGHPYSLADIPMPCPPHQGPDRNLGHFIPSFDDDPKSRFLDEIAYVTNGEGVKSPQPKKRLRRSASDVQQSSSSLQVPSQTSGPEEKKRLGELSRVTPDEFWERMSFRQECVAGAITGFFTLVVSTRRDKSRSPSSPLEPQPGHISAQLIKRVLSSLMTGVEFSTVERAIKGTEAIENSIRGLCDGVSALPPLPGSSQPTIVDGSENEERTTPPPMKERPRTLAPPSTPPRKGPHVLPEVSPNPFPEPTTSLDTYHSHIYGSVTVTNPAAVKKKDGENGGSSMTSSADAPVTVLVVRRKKKRPAE